MDPMLGEIWDEDHPEHSILTASCLNKKNVHEVYCRIMLHGRCFPPLPSSQSPNQARPPSTFHPTLTTPQKPKFDTLPREILYPIQQIRHISFPWTASPDLQRVGDAGFIRWFEILGTYQEDLATNHGSWEGSYKLTRSACSCSVKIPRKLMLPISRYIRTEHVGYKGCLYA
jgi:hypothetical protein